MLVSAVALHVITGAAYLIVAALCAVDIGRIRHNGDRAAIPFSLVLGLVMFMMGLHHLDYAHHLRDVDHVAFSDFATILMSVPPAAVWVYLRIERRGDRLIHDHARWIRNSVSGFVITSAFLIGFTSGRARGTADCDHTPVFDLNPWWHYFPQVVTSVAFAYVAVRLWGQARTDYRNRHYWSVSGLALSAVFATCANVHLAQALNIMRGFTQADGHSYVIEWATAAAAVAWVLLVRRVARTSSS